MFDYDIQRCTRKCAATDRELNVGEICYSALVAEGAAVVRRDYPAESWHAPPENTIGWWKTTIVDPHAGRMHWAPNDVMLHYFERLLEDSSADDARYVLALLLVRRRVLRVDGHEQDAAGRDTIVLYCSRNETTYRVPEILPSSGRAAEIQQQLSALLQTNGNQQQQSESTQKQ